MSERTVSTTNLFTACYLFSHGNRLSGIEESVSGYDGAAELELRFTGARAEADRRYCLEHQVSSTGPELLALLDELGRLVRERRQGGRA